MNTIEGLCIDCKRPVYVLTGQAIRCKTCHSKIVAEYLAAKKILEGFENGKD